jgi:uncharacterized protein (TIGR02246 family)
MQRATPSRQALGPAASAGSGPVVTVALQATDLSGRGRTERQLLSLAVGQGVLSARLEAELAALEPGTVRRWRVGPRERPYPFKGHPHLPSNGLIWMELELLESRSPTLPGDGPSGCALISQGEVQDLFERWNSALQSQDPEQVARLYSREAVLLPTLSDEPRTDHEGIVDYFSHFLVQRPHGEISQREILIGCNMLQDAGLYTFRFADGGTAQARYSFIYVFESGEWKISHHHSSLLPEATQS